MDHKDIFWDIPEEIREKVPEKEDDLGPFYTYLYQQYLKVGLYCQMSPEEFFKTPWSMIDYISDDIDNRLKPYLPPDPHAGSGEGSMPLNYYHLALLLFGSALFGSSNE